MGQAGQSCAQLRMQLCTFEHKHGAGGAIVRTYVRTVVHANVYICAQAWGEEGQVCAQLCLQLCTVVHNHGGGGAVLCAVAHTLVCN